MATPLLARQLAQGGKQVDVPMNDSQTAARAGSLFSRARSMAQWLWNGTTPAEQWFGPGQPLEPVAPEDVAGRLYDYPMTYNLQWQPRVGMTPFEELYTLADTHDITRLCIETRKDQMARQKWTIRLRETSGKKFGKDVPELVQFFAKPDKRENWLQWQGRILEDMFVGDCATLYVRRALDNSLYGFEPIDGSTIVLRADPWGRVPLNGAAYTQRLKGLPAVDYTREQLVYAPRRLRNQKGEYGLSCVEQIIITVNMALRRQFHQLAWYTDGSAPDLIIGVPKEWSNKEVNKLTAYWQIHFRGNSAEKRGHPMVIPGGNECKFENTKKDPLKDEFDEWLARVVCYAFSLPPTPFVKQMNRATADTAQETALSEGLAPIMLWWKNLMDDLLTRLGRPDCEFAWQEEEAIDPETRAKIHWGYMDRGVITRNEVRDDLGKDPLDGADQPLVLQTMVVPPTGAAPSAPVEPTPNPPEPKKLAKKAKTVKLPSRNRTDLLKMENRFALDAAKELSKIRKTVISRVGTGDHMVIDADFAGLHKLMAKHLKSICEGGVSAAAEALKGHLKKSMRKAEGEEVDPVLEMLKLANERGAEWASQHAGERIKDIEDTTREGVRELTDKAISEGWSNDELAEELEDAWEFGSDRAELIARTESALADLHGNLELSKEAGIERVQWLTADADACDQCDALDGEEADIDGEFPDGTPADDVAHPACRCDRTAVIPADSEED